MEKNKLQIATIVLCAVLLLAVLWQGQRIAALEKTVREQYSSLWNRVDGISGNVTQNVANLLEEKEKLVEEYALETVAVDKETNCVSADLVFTLKEWSADTKVCALLTADGETTEYPMTPTAGGVFSVQLIFPLNSDAEYGLDAAVERNGVVTREEVACGAFSDLLPPCLTSWGGQVPYFEGERIHFSEGFDVNFEQENYLELIEQAEFRVYCNDERIDTPAAKLNAMNNGFAMTLEAEYENGTEQDFSYEAALKDRFCLSFFCTDTNGLCYEYVLGNWTITTNGAEEYEPEIEWPILSWEE